MKRVKLENLQAFETINRSAQFKHLIIHDTSAGRQPSYTVIRMLAGSRAQVVGYEVDMDFAKGIIRDFEESWSKLSLTKRRDFYMENGFSKEDALAFEPDNEAYARLCGVPR